MLNPTPKVNAQYGAPMGRPACGHGARPTTPFELRKIRINSGGYDDGGAYWGLGAPLYWYCAYETNDTVETGRCLYCNQSVRGAINGDCRGIDGRERGQDHKFETCSEDVEISSYIRASDREHAKEIIRAKYPEAKFKR